jgi:cyclic pyranopterin phosphate synthase
MPPLIDQLIDKYDRPIRKLRLSLTDRCNLRCNYCMPLNATFMKSEQYLSATEYTEIIQELAQLGITSVRLTGGEPFLRADFADILANIAQIEGIELSLTTNGILLTPHLSLLKQQGIKKLNISLDSLQADTFRKITHGQNLGTVLNAIETAVSQGFQVKLNMVLIANQNAHELPAMVAYAKKWGIEVRFLELMQIGYACNLPQDSFISAKTMIECLSQHYQLISIPSPKDSTAFRFRTTCGAQIGFIASESQPFCGHCSRWRLSADGILRACLFKEAGISLKHLTADQRYQVYQQVLGMKPALRSSQVSHAMYSIGG